MRLEKFDLFDENHDLFNSHETDSNSLFTKEENRFLTQNDTLTNSGFLNEETTEIQTPDSSWKILVVDNEKDIIKIAKTAFKEYKFQNNELIFLEAYNKEDAKQLITDNKDIALIFIDMLIDSNNSNLELVRFIREEIKNELVQIVLTTGEPGYAPEKEIFTGYKINFFQTKSELTEIKLFTLTTSLLDSYHALKSIRDNNITLKKMVAEKTLDLRVKNEEYKNAIATKNKMFSIIAHDLVNPFNSLLGFSDILRNQCENLPTEKIKQFSEVMWQTSRSTCDLLSNLLEWARVQTGKISFSPQKIALCTLIKTNIELLNLQARQKNIQLNGSCEEEVFIYGDTFMINTVLRNLISNGIKFTSKGGVNITVNIVDDQCIIDITDTGTGISHSKIENLFEPETLSIPGTAGESGTGIGLMVCNEFMHLNNGSIKVTSKVNKGSTFTLTLPLYRS
jgi:signal transduction histidine kinase